jgi:hypothetical protein
MLLACLLACILHPLFCTDFLACNSFVSLVSLFPTLTHLPSTLQQQGFVPSDQRARRTYMEAPSAAMVRPQTYVPASVPPQMHYQGPLQGMAPRFAPDAGAGLRGPARPVAGYGAYSSTISPALLGQHPMSPEAQMTNPVNVAVPPAVGFPGPAPGVAPMLANGGPRRAPPATRYGYPSAAPVGVFPAPAMLGSSPNATMPYSTTGSQARGYSSGAPGAAIQQQQLGYPAASRAPVSGAAPTAPTAPPTLVSPPALAVASTASVVPSKPSLVIVDKRGRDSRRESDKA